MTLEEFNYQTRRVYTHSSERVCSTEQWAGYCCCLFGELLGSLLWLRRRLVRQTLLYASVDVFPRRGIGFHIKTSATDRRSLCSAESDAFDRTPATTTSTTSCETRRSVWEEEREEMMKRRRKKKVTEKPPNIWWFSIGRMIFHLNSDDIRFLIHISEYVCMKTSAQSNFSFIAAQSDAKRRREWKTIIHFMLNDAMVDAERLKSRFR